MIQTQKVLILRIHIITPDRKVMHTKVKLFFHARRKGNWYNQAMKGVQGKWNLPVPPVRLSLMAATMQMT